MPCYQPLSSLLQPEVARVSSRIVRWGWVVEKDGCVAGWAHPLGKSAHLFGDTSIHRLPYWQVNLHEVGASSLR